MLVLVSRSVYAARDLDDLVICQKEGEAVWIQFTGEEALF
jgi:hypothetical protein